MATNAERQAAYRQCRLNAEDAPFERLNTVVTVCAKRALERLSKHYAVTQREVLERLLGQAETDAIREMTPKGRRAYYGD